jgi:hypothetical protein
VRTVLRAYGHRGVDLRMACWRLNVVLTVKIHWPLRSSRRAGSGPDLACRGLTLPVGYFGYDSVRYVVSNWPAARTPMRWVRLMPSC